MALTKSQRAAMMPQQIAQSRKIPKLTCKVLANIKDADADENIGGNLKKGETVEIDSGVARVLAHKGLVEVIEPKDPEQFKDTADPDADASTEPKSKRSGKGALVNDGK